MSNAIVDRFKVIDTDTHLVEPPDLWTSRMSTKWGDLVPHVRWDDNAKEEAWFVGDQRLAPVGAAAQAGWPEYPPAHPPRWEDADPHTWDAKLRLERMDEYGVCAQVLYPNVALFNSAPAPGVGDAELTLDVHPGLQRLPDRVVQRRARPADRRHDAAVLGPRRDARRDRALRGDGPQGHRLLPGPVGVRPAAASPIRTGTRCGRTAQEMRQPVNFHIASGDMSLLDDTGHPSVGEHAQLRVDRACRSSSATPGRSPTSSAAASATASRISNFVSVESGVGWIPFALDALDWQWKNCGVAHEHPEYDLLPSEYFAPPDLRLLLVRGGRRSLRHRAARPRQHPVRDRLPAPDEHVARPGDRPPSAPNIYLEQNFAGLADDDPAQDPARQRGPALPPRLTSRCGPHRSAPGIGRGPVHSATR